MFTQTTQKALNTTEAAPCDQESVAGVLALNFEWPEESEVPEWIELIPPGVPVIGRDGRNWINDQPQAVVSASKLPLPLDWEHATELKAPKGDRANAAGWIEELQVREGGSIWGRVEWTGNGKYDVAHRDYRFISPVFYFQSETKRIMQLVSAALTNRHNLELTALNQKGSPQTEQVMNWEKLLAALGLGKEATEEQALNAIQKLKDDHTLALNTALNQAQTPSLDKFVPRGDYDLAMNRAKDAEEALADGKKADLEKEIEVAINAALEAGKIVPASKDFYLATCRAEGGLENFKTFLKAAPVIAGDSDLGNKDPEKGAEGKALNSVEALLVPVFENSAEDIEKFGRA